MTDNSMTIQEILEAATWTFAKTMPQNPHFWTLRKDWEQDTDYEFAFDYIHAHGEEKVFGRTTYRVLFINGWRYWAMTDDLTKSRLMNRAEGPI